MFICGSRSFGHHQSEDKNGSYVSSNATPKRSKRSKSLSKFIIKESTNKNPYADRGLDKFSALLADLEEKKLEIYRQMVCENISFIRFVYSSDSEDVKPIVVKVKSKNIKGFLKHSRNSASTAVTNSTAVTVSDKSVNEKREMVKLPQGQYSLPVVMVLILLFLAIHGRSFAILCTLIVWYVVPNNALEGALAAASRRMKEKRKVGEKKNLPR